MAGRSITANFTVTYLTSFGQSIVVQLESKADSSGKGAVLPLMYDTSAPAGLWLGSQMVRLTDGSIRYRYALQHSQGDGDARLEFVDGWREVSVAKHAEEVSLMDSWAAPGLLTLLSSAAAKETLFSPDAGSSASLEGSCVAEPTESPFGTACNQYISFRVVSEPRLSSSDCEVAVVGNLPSLGKWDPEKAMVMQRGQSDNHLTVTFPLRPEDVTFLQGDTVKSTRAVGGKEVIGVDTDTSTFPAPPHSARATNLPLEYKFILRWKGDGQGSARTVVWETGGNRVRHKVPVGGNSVVLVTDSFIRLPTGPCMDDGYRLSLASASPASSSSSSSSTSAAPHCCASMAWKGAGVSVSLFSLASSQNAAGVDSGCGDFRSLMGLVSWAASCGLKVIHLAPLNDTGSSSATADPYQPISSCALHPAYINLNWALEWIDLQRSGVGGLLRNNKHVEEQSPTGRGSGAGTESASTSPFADPPLPPSPPSTSPVPFDVQAGIDSSRAPPTPSDARPLLMASSRRESTPVSLPATSGAQTSRSAWVVPEALRSRITRGSGTGGSSGRVGTGRRGHHQFASSSSLSAFARPLSSGSLLGSAGPPRLSRSPSWTTSGAGMGSAPALAEDGSSGPPSAFSSSGGTGGGSSSAGASSRPTAPPVDWEATLRDKMSLLRGMYRAVGEATMQHREFQRWFRLNREWLRPYALFCFLRDTLGSSDPREWGTKATGKITATAISSLTDPSSFHYEAICFHYFVQFLAHLQLQEVATYAREEKKIMLSVDIAGPGMPYNSVDVWAWSENFHVNKRCGVPPAQEFAAREVGASGDSGSAGRAWCNQVPFNWERMSKKDNDYSWWRMRSRHLSQYFGGVRLCKALEYFRSFIVPEDAVLSASRGLFSPLTSVVQLPSSSSEPIKATSTEDKTAQGGSTVDSGRRDGGSTPPTSHYGFTAAQLEAAGISPSQLKRLCEPYVREWTLRSALGPGFASVASRFLRLCIPTAPRTSSNNDDAAGSSDASTGAAHYVFKRVYRSESAIKCALEGTPEEWMVEPLVSLLNNVCLLAVKKTQHKGAGSNVDGGQVLTYLDDNEEDEDDDDSDGVETDGKRGTRRYRHYTFHPRIGMFATTSYLESDASLRRALSTLNSVYFESSGLQGSVWRETGLKRLSTFLRIMMATPRAAPSADSAGTGGEDSELTSTTSAAHWSPVIMADDLGADNVAGCRDVLRQLGIIGTECHRMPSATTQGGGYHSSTAGFSDPLSYDYGTVATPSTFFTSPLRQWWEEESTSAMSFYRAFLASPRDAAARRHCHDVPAHLFGRPSASSFHSRSSNDEKPASRESSEGDLSSPSKAIISSSASKAAAGSRGLIHSASATAITALDPDHLPMSCTSEVAASLISHYSRSGSVLALFQIQDLLAVDSSLRAADPFERVAFPSFSNQVWRWRMPVSIEELNGENGRALRAKLRSLLGDTGRLGVVG